MQVIYANPPESVIAIGKFESLHLGHQALIHKAKAAAANRGLPTVVMSFSPHPFIVLGNRGYKPLLTAEEAAWVLREICKVDFFLQYPFTRGLSQMPPASFCRVLFDDLKARELFVGEDYRFGANRGGTVAHLINEALPRGAGVTVVPPEMKDGVKISTSLIRKLIEEGKHDEANGLLGFAYPPPV